MQALRIYQFCNKDLVISNLRLSRSFGFQPSAPSFPYSLCKGVFSTSSDSLSEWVTLDLAFVGKLSFISRSSGLMCSIVFIGEDAECVGSNLCSKFDFSFVSGVLQNLMRSLLFILSMRSMKSSLGRSNPTPSKTMWCLLLFFCVLKIVKNKYCVNKSRDMRPFFYEKSLLIDKLVIMV